MDTEERRLKSFNSWPPDAAVKPADLARAGFFYQGAGDEVTCFSCQYKLGQWEPGDVPHKEHQRLNPECSFISEGCYGDVLDSAMIKPPDIRPPQYSRTQSDSVMIKAPDYHSGRVIQDNIKHLNQAKIKPQVVNITNQQSELKNIIHHTSNIELEKPDYSDVKMRMDTFKSWRQAVPNPCNLAKAGFLYTGQGDTIQCFNCDGVLYDLGENMNVVNGHVCEQTKKQQPVQHTEVPQTTPPGAASYSNMGSALEVRSLQTAGSVSPRSPSPRLQNPPNTDAGVTQPGVLPGCQGMADCPNCRDILFEPCGHFICCMRCAENCQLCPSCKQFIQERLQLNVSRVSIINKN